MTGSALKRHAPAGFETDLEILERLHRPTSGKIVEAFWPVSGWLPAKFTKVLDEGRIRVEWVADGAISDLPSHFVQKFGGDSSYERAPLAPAPGVATVLRAARPDWSEKEVRQARLKLSKAGVGSASALAESFVPGCKEGVNRRLSKIGFKTFAPKTVLLLREECSRLLSESELPKTTPPNGNHVTAASLACGPVAPSRGRFTQMMKAREAVCDSDVGINPCEKPSPPGVGSKCDHTAPPESTIAASTCSSIDTTERAAAFDSDQVGANIADDASADVSNDLDGGSKLKPGDVRPLPTQAQFSEEEPSLRVSWRTCDQGHRLEAGPIAYDGSCDICGADIDVGCCTMQCLPCAFDMCDRCYKR